MEASLLLAFMSLLRANQKARKAGLKYPRPLRAEPCSTKKYPTHGNNTHTGDPAEAGGVLQTQFTSQFGGDPLLHQRVPGWPKTPYK